MRNPTRFARLLACAGVCAGLASAAGDAGAAPKKKATATPPLPNVLLLVDNSGSMEFMIDGSKPEDAQNNPSAVTNNNAACSVTATTGGSATDPNRWGTLVQALTGSFSAGYRCWSEDRNGSTFQQEYTINGVAPYDSGYFLPYHRPVAQDSSGNNCAYGPYKLPDQGGGSGDGVGAGTFTTLRDPSAQSVDFPGDALALFAVGDLVAKSNKASTANATCSAFEQAPDGFIDAGRDLVRFGLMMFDNDPNQGTGVNSLVPTSTPFTGMWSYFLGWDTGTGGTNYAQGWPAGCSTPAPFEVGARNPAAPPWEGRLVMFPDPGAPLADLEANNDQVGQVILASRPYGATPIMGMLSDARDYFWNDPNGPMQADPYSNDKSGSTVGCRDQYIILITDGAPNMDLESSCQGTSPTPAGHCPYGTDSTGTWNSTNNKQGSADIVADLAKGGSSGQNVPVQTFVIGFATSTYQNSGGTLAQCASLVGSNLQLTSTAQTMCADPTQNVPGSALAACCTLEQIAIQGGTGNGAFFVDSGTALNAALSTILGSIASQASSRTLPTYSPVLNSIGSTFSVSSTYLASFNPAPPTSTAVLWPWSGDIQRIRTICDLTATPPAVAQPIDTSKNDDFKTNLDSSSSRTYFSVQDSATLVDSTATMRPFIGATDPDGVGTRTGQEVKVDISKTNAGFSAGLGPYFNINTNCPAFKDPLGNVQPALSPDVCAQTALAFAVAQNYSPMGVSGASFKFSEFSRASGNSNGFSGFGAILHSNPTIAPQPSAQSRDDSYRAFTTINQARPPVLYVSTLDGLLHAFDVTSDLNAPSATDGTAPLDKAPVQNEIWAFIPPAILPLLKGNFPGGQQTVLDGSPVTKDVVFSRDAKGTTDASNWHTAVVAGFGSSARGYYALDVTDPLVKKWQAETIGTPSATPTANTAGTGPHFLWQLTKLSPCAAGATASCIQNNEVQPFGKHSVTPAIATVALTVGSATKEVGVAILPGGQDDGPFGECNRNVILTGPSSTDATPANGDWTPRTMVRQWNSNGCSKGVSGRTVSIVRLDTGEILRVFGRCNKPGNTGPCAAGQIPADQSDIPASIIALNKGTHVDFDSPMTGVPSPYPAQVDAVMSKFYIGDADGTIWRFDTTNTDPSKWTAELYFDTFSQQAMAKLPAPTAKDAKGNTLKQASTASQYADISQPIQVPPVISVDSVGNLVMHVATGDQDTFTTSVFVPGKDNDSDDLLAAYNFVYSVTERLDTTLSPNKLRASVNWYYPFTNGSRVTGPMAVFDSVFYFASYSPAATSSVCTAGQGLLWGVDYTTITGCSSGNDNVGCAGDARMTDLSGNLVQNYDPGGTGGDPSLEGHVISGVSVRLTPPCANTAQVNDPFAGGTYGGLASMTPASYGLFANVSTGATSTAVKGQSGATVAKAIKSPRTATTIDSWAAIVE